MVQEYLDAAEVHQAIDYSVKRTVKLANRAADQLRHLGKNELSAEKLLGVFDLEYPASLWSAHHLLEFHSLAENAKIRAVSRIRKEIAMGGMNAIGEDIFLQELLNS